MPALQPVIQKSSGSAVRIENAAAGWRFHTSHVREKARRSVYCVPPGEPSYQAISSEA